MTRQAGTLILRNVVVLVAVALPIGTTVLFLMDGLASRNDWMSAGDLGLIYATLLIPIAMGGLLHQFLLAYVFERLDRSPTWVAVLTSPLVLSILIVLVYPPFLLRNAAAMAAGLGIYLALYKPPIEQRSSVAE